MNSIQYKELITPLIKNNISMYNGSQYAIVSIFLKRRVKYFLTENQ